MDEKLKRTIRDANRIMAGQGRSGRGRFVEAVVALSARVSIFMAHQTITASLIDAWSANPAPVLPPSYKLSRMGDERPDIEWAGHGLDALVHGFGPRGRVKLRFMGMRHRAGKVPLDTFVKGMLAAIYLGEMTLEEAIVRVK